MPSFHQLTVKDIRRETADAVSVAFEVPETLESEYQFIQGQYLTLRTEINGEEVRRSYSVCVSPLDQELRVAIKKVPGGKFSTFANESLQVGDQLDVMTPMGNFHTPLDAQQEKTYVGFAAGSGITPIISILKTVLKVESGSRFILFYSNKGFESIIFRQEIEALKNQYLDRFIIHHVFSRERLGLDLFNGRIDEEKCRLFAKHFFNPAQVDEYFICGPETMMLAISETLKEVGVAKEKIHFELFGTPGQKREPNPAVREEPTFDPKKESRVTVVLDGNSFEFNLPYGGTNVLDAALKEGADLPFSCKGGVCMTCRAKITEGSADMDVNYALEREEVVEGYVLTCQAHPRTEAITVNFDEH